MDVTATLAAGGLRLNVSPGDGVFVDERSLLGGFDKDGFAKRSDGWYSANYDSAARHVRVHLHAFVGGLTLTPDSGVGGDRSNRCRMPRIEIRSRHPTSIFPAISMSFRAADDFASDTTIGRPSSPPCSTGG